LKEGNEEGEEGVEGRSNDALSHVESRLDNRDRTAPLSRHAKRRRRRRHSNTSFLPSMPPSLLPSYLSLFIPSFFNDILKSLWDVSSRLGDVLCARASLLRPFNATPGSEVTNSMTGLWRCSAQPKREREREREGSPGCWTRF